MSNTMTPEQCAALSAFTKAFAAYITTDYGKDPDAGMRCALRIAMAEQELLDDAIDPALIDACKQAAVATRH